MHSKTVDSFLQYSFAVALCAKVSRRSDNCYAMITVVVSIHAAFYANCSHRWRTSTYWPEIISVSVPVNTLTSQMQPCVVFVQSDALSEASCTTVRKVL